MSEEQNTKPRKARPSAIVADIVISESEIANVLPDYSYRLEYDNPEKFKSIMYQLGMDIYQGYSR